MWKNRLAYGLVLLTAAVLLFLYSKPFLLTVLIVLLLLMVINGMLILHDAHSIRVSMRVRPGGQQGKDVNLNITVNSDKKLLAAGQYTASLKPLEGRIGTTAISAVSGGIVLEVYEERTVRSFLEHLVTTNKNTSFKTRFKLHYAGLLYPWFARAQKAQLTD